MSKLMLLAAATLFAASAGAQTYRWIDKDGRVHYSDTPPPGAAAKSVQERSGSAVSGSGTASTANLPFAVQQAAKNFPVTLYTAENCGDACKDARALLAKRGVPYREVGVGDEKTREELKRVSGGDVVPVLLVGRSATKGYEEESWHGALDGGGYPRSAPPLTAQQQPAPAAAGKTETPKPVEEPAPRPRGPYLPQ
jgi:glutaredoxin